MDVIITLLVLLPLLLILWLANFADRKRAEGEADSARLLGLVSQGGLVALYAVLILLGVLLGAVGWLAQSPFGTELGNTYRSLGFDPTVLPRMGLGLWLSSLVGIVLLLRPLRRLFGRQVRAFDPSSTVQAVALSYSALILLNLLVTLGLGLHNLTQLMESNTAEGVAYNPMAGIWAQDIIFAVMALVGVGWLSRRNLSSALRRVGVVLPSWRQAITGVGTGLLMVPVILLLEYLASLLGISANSDVEKLTNQMLGPLLTSVPGVLTLGLAAALGEESVFRGALQPRFGLFLTALLFALLHSNYGLSLSTLLVFVVGLILGLLRRRFNTSTSMLAHAVYNISLGVIAYLGWLGNL